MATGACIDLGCSDAGAFDVQQRLKTSLTSDRFNGGLLRSPNKRATCDLVVGAAAAFWNLDWCGDYLDW